MNERVLYPPLMRFLDAPNRFLTCDMRGSSPFGIELHGEQLKVDVSAFEWNNDYEINAIAVECKLNGGWRVPSEALAQGTAYQTLFQETYIASNVEGESLGYLKQILETLGLGYIYVNEGGGAERVLEAGCSPSWFDQDLHRIQVRRKAVVALAFQEEYGKESIRVGRADRPREIWVSNRRDKSCNFFLHLHPASEELGISEDELHVGFNIEKKRVVRRGIRNLDLREYQRILSSLPSDYSLLLWDTRTRGTDRLILRVRANEVSLSELEDVMGEIRSLDYRVCLQVARVMPARLLDEMQREVITRMVRAVNKEVQPIFENMKGCGSG